MGFADEETVQRAELLMKELQVGPDDRRVVEPARQAAEDGERRGKGNEGIFCGAALELRDGTIVTGKNSPLMHAASALVLNAVKTPGRNPRPDPPALALASSSPSAASRRTILGSKTVSLDLEETLIALSISAATNPAAQLAMEKLGRMSGCEVHLTPYPDARRRSRPEAPGREPDQRPTLFHPRSV